MIEFCKWGSASVLALIAVLFLIYTISEIFDDIKKMPRKKPKKKKEPVIQSVTEGPRILEYPKIKSVKCHICHCKYVGEAEHLRSDPFGSRFEIGITCPLCGTFNRVEFEEEER